MTESIELDGEERRLLATYADGPRIWDAAALYPTVVSLQEKGVIVPVPGSSASAITAAGRRAIKRCEALAHKGTGVGTCDRPLDEHGNCDRAASHVAD